LTGNLLPTIRRGLLPPSSRFNNPGMDAASSAEKSLTNYQYARHNTTGYYKLHKQNNGNIDNKFKRNGKRQILFIHLLITW
jgi:hypothetical protein